MNTPRRHSLRRLAKNRKRGQSIPIIALMIVILVAMVGLSVDVGNTFNKEREAVSAGNAAALAGMSAYVGRGPGTLDQTIYEAITKSLQSNGIVTDPSADGAVQISAYYLNAQGETLPGHPVVGAGGTAPDGAAYIQVKLDGKIETSFARVVGRNDLPINASAHAGLCPVNSGVYPLAIDTAVITDNQFNDDGTTEPAEYVELEDGMVQRRVYMRDGDDSPGNFGWLRWMRDRGANGTSATSAGELSASMTGDGNIAWGFDEAPWPAGETMPQGYPNEPGTLNPGDWIWGSPGWSNSAEQRAAIDEHIFTSTFMILPIYDRMIGQGSSVQVRVIRLGVFVITGSGRDGSRPYFDMIYLGDPTGQYTACSVTPPPPEDANLLDLFGNVSFYPEYQIIPTTQKPIQYVVVLDASGSMSANFNGQCNNNGLKQCANGPVGFPEVEVLGTGPTYYWNKVEERRIYVAKKALERLVTLSNMPGNPGYSDARPSDQMAVVWFNSSVPSGNTKAFSNNADSIKTYIKTLNKTSNDNYRSQGGTNGAAGLYRASLLYKAAPKTVLFNGNQVEYKRVVLFITDGVSNQFLNTSASDLLGGQSTSDTYPKKTYCRNLADKVIESATCQTTDVGGKYNGWDRPITQMIKTSQENLRNTTVNAEVFAIALSSIPSTGLRDGVPSSPNYFFSAESLEVYPGGKTNVDVIIDAINEKVELGDCIAGPNGTSTGTITSAEFGSNPNGFEYPKVGEVIISNDTDEFTASIIADGSGTLSYSFTNVPQGTYRMQAYLFYHHPLDPPNTVRMYSRIWSAGQAVSDFTVEVSPSSQGGSFVHRIEQPLTLKLSGDVCPTL